MKRSFTHYFIWQKILVVMITAALLFSVQDAWSQVRELPRKQKKKKAILPPENLSGKMLAALQYNFNTSGLQGAILSNPTSLQFGPDGRLYVSQQNGVIKAMTIRRNGPNDYAVTATEIINLINQIPNHNDDGTLNTSVVTRQVTGILVTGTEAVPVLYVSSSDSRIGGGSTKGDVNLDTNSGIISRLTKTSTGWEKVDLVRGLPRSEENHSVNGMQLDAATNMLYLAVGGFTNAGSPSNNFTFSCEYALSAAILSIDLAAIELMPTIGTGNTAYKYDIPTLDDPTRANNPDGTDINDPFGGNDGLNQAKIVAGGPVQIYSSGYRNAYDLVITKTPGKEGRMYTVDNGPNGGWGGYPENEGPGGTVTNNYVTGEPGSTGPGVNDPKVNNLDNLHYIGNVGTYVPGSHYAGHPTPTRANPAGAGLYTHNGTTGVWRTSKTGSYPLPQDWPPLPLSQANPIEGDYQNPGERDLALLTFPTSTNGLVEYTASNFEGTLKGVLLAASYNGDIYRINFTEDGRDVTNTRLSTNKLNQDIAFASGFGSQPLDITAQGDHEIFPGSVWAATYGSNAITIFEPADFTNCTGIYSTSMDDDLDNYSNADEIDNGTNPCSASSRPQDFDGDFISDLNDPDDDSDGLGDHTDFFPLDAQNGLTTNLPIRYDLFNNDPGFGLFGLGFTGLMTNQLSDNDYINLYDEENLIAGGAVGAFSIVATSAGDALGALDNQENGFQFGVNVSASTGPFTVHAGMLAPFFDYNTPQDNQSQGIFIGTGNQRDYLKIVLNANGGTGGIEVVYENAGVATTNQYLLTGGIPGSSLDLYLEVDPITGKVQPKYVRDGGAKVSVGNPIQLQGALLTAVQASPALAIGIIATSRNAVPFTATWDIITVTADPAAAIGNWQTVVPQTGAPTARHENSFVQVGDRFYLLGGRGIKPVQAYDPINKKWIDKANTPIAMHHFQAVAMDGLIYVAGAFTGSYPYETPIPKVYIYNPLTDKWLEGPSIPEARRRGSAGVVVHNNKLYLVSGITDGHNSGHVTWFDEYDPATNTWRVLPNTPRARDHSHAVVVNNKLYMAGGRRSSYATGETFSLTVPEVDVFDFSTNTWTTLPSTSNIPTQRAGSTTAVLGNEVLVIGGESVSQSEAHKNTEALNTQTNTWRSLADLQIGRHGTQAIVNNNGIYVVAGSGSRGGTPELNSMEAFYMFAPSQPIVTAITQSSLSAPTEVKFGIVEANTTSTKTIKLTNSGANQSIVISSLEITGATEFTYTAPYALPFVLPVGASVNLSVSFKPANTESKAAVMKITHSGTGGSSNIALSGGKEGYALRINTGGAQMTAYNNAFSADQYFLGGKAHTNTQASIAGTEDDALYQTERTATVDLGGFSYNIPLTAGNYLLRLHFAEIHYGATGGGSYGIGKRVFSVTAEGNPIPGLTNYDIIADVGTMTAVVKEVVVEVTDGTLNLDFTASVNRPKISAIELIEQPTTATGTLAANPASLHFFSQQAGTTSSSQAITLTNNSTSSIQVSSVSVTGTNNNEFLHSFTSPITINAEGTAAINVRFRPASLGTKVASLNIIHTGTNSPITVGLTGEGIDNNSSAVYRINTGGAQMTAYSNTFSADQYFVGGKTHTNTQPSIEGTEDDALYHTERTATADLEGFSYNIPLTAGNYLLRLHFAEIHYGATGGGSYGIGKRVFSVTAEGNPIPGLTNYDIIADVGTMTAVVKEVVVEVTDGTLNLDFTASVNRPKISAIEVLGSTTGGNQSPTVSISSPANNASYTAPASISITASAADTDGSISKVEFFQGTTKLGEDLTSPYTYSWSNVTAGSYNLTAQATDDDGAMTTSAVVTVNVSGASNQAPVVSNPIPDQNATVGQAYSFSFAANTFSDADGDALSYSADQGAGTSLPAWLSFSSASRSFSGTPPQDSPASLNLRVTASDGNGGSVSDTFVLSIAPASSTTAVRINSAGGALTNSLGSFMADAYYVPDKGYLYSTSAGIANTSDDAMYQTARGAEKSQGTFSYNIPISNGSYTVVLHFAELSFSGIGQRVFDVSLEGSKVLDNYDIVQRSGGRYRAVQETFPVSVSDGNLTLYLSALSSDGGANRPKISAIEVLPANNASRLGADVTLTEDMERLVAYPNPVGELTTISFSLAKEGTYSLDLYDAKGALVSKIHEGKAMAGETTNVSLDGTALSEGLYLVMLRSNNNVKMLRLVVAK